jgi:hypothetical protein
MERQLREDKLLETGEHLRQRIAERFPGSGLSRVAAEVVLTTRESVVRTEGIRQPNLWLRIGLAALGLLLFVGLWFAIPTKEGHRSPWQRVLDTLNESRGILVYLGAVAVFLWTLEVRFKRRKALRAVHELRALAHLIDMHQLAKDPDWLGKSGGPTSGGKPMNADTMGRYLHYCTELLALVSKIGHLYVRDFPDAGAVAAVDNCEGLATGLSQKIWQKIMILDRIRTDAGGNAPAAASPIPAVPAVGPIPEP